MALANFAMQTSGLDRIQRELQLTPRQVRNALRSAVDKTTREARNIIVDTIAQETGAKPAALRKNVVITERSTQARVSAEVTALDKPMLVKDLGPEINRQTGEIRLDRSAVPGRGPERLEFAFRPVSKPGKSRKGRKRKNWPRGAIFERKGAGSNRSKRYPLTSARGPSTAEFIGPVLTKVAGAVIERLEAQFIAAFDKFRQQQSEGSPDG
jgi:hypothetical protein